MSVSVKYIPQKDSEKLFWLKTFSAKAEAFSTTLNIPATTVAQLAIDAEVFEKMVLHTDAARSYAEAVTELRNQLRNGGTKSMSIPKPPATISLPAGAKTDIFGRVRNLVQLIKKHPSYNQSIGEELGVVAPKSVENIHEWKPRLHISLNAGMPVVKWKKGRSHGLKLKVDRGSGTFELANTCSTSRFTDRHPLPPIGQGAIWRYAGIYVLKDQEVGQYSDVVSVSVTGMP